MKISSWISKLGMMLPVPSNNKHEVNFFRPFIITFHKLQYNFSSISNINPVNYYLYNSYQHSYFYNFIYRSHLSNQLINLSFIHSFIHLSIHPSIHPFIYPSTHPSIPSPPQSKSDTLVKVCDYIKELKAHKKKLTQKCTEFKSIKEVRRVSLN